jgi:hypothetical protein
MDFVALLKIKPKGPCSLVNAFCKFTAIEEIAGGKSALST